MDNISKNVEHFYELALKYCTFLTQGLLLEDDVEYLMSLLLRLYDAALQLPDIEPESVEEAEVGISPPAIHIQFESSYYQVFDPFVEEEPVEGLLEDDLQDIYCDLMSGINEYRKGNLGNAVFEWTFLLDNHWGNHAVNALRVLHSVRTI